MNYYTSSTKAIISLLVLVVAVLCVYYFAPNTDGGERVVSVGLELDEKLDNFTPVRITELSIAMKSELFKELIPYFPVTRKCEKEFMANSVIVGVVTKDTRYIEAANDAIEHCFSRQLPDGSIGNTVDTFALGHGLLEVYLVLEEVNLFDSDDSKIKMLNNLYELVEYVNQNISVDMVMDEENTNIIAAMSTFYDFAYKIFNEERYKDMSTLYLDEVLTREINGVFPESGGVDTGYQRVTLYKLMIQYLMGNVEIIDSLERGWEWELANLDDSGLMDVTNNLRTGVDPKTGKCREIGKSGQCKLIDYPEIAFYLIMWNEIEGSEEAYLKAEKIVQNLKKGGVYDWVIYPDYI